MILHALCNTQPPSSNQGHRPGTGSSDLNFSAGESGRKLMETICGHFGLLGIRARPGCQAASWAPLKLGGNLYPHLLKSRSHEGVPGNPGKSPKEGQEDQKILKALGGFP